LDDRRYLQNFVLITPPRPGPNRVRIDLAQRGLRTPDAESALTPIRTGWRTSKGAAKEVWNFGCRPITLIDSARQIPGVPGLHRRPDPAGLGVRHRFGCCRYHRRLMKREKLRMMTSTEIRASFLEFFRKNGHAVVPSSSLVPATTRRCCSPTRAWFNSRRFLGKETRDYSRAATAQRCVRRAASTTTSRMWVIRHGITRSSRCSAISASATTSSARRFISRGIS